MYNCSCSLRCPFSALSDDLLQARMNILSYTDCQNYLRNSFLRDQTQFCVGTIPTEADINFCQVGRSVGYRPTSTLWAHYTTSVQGKGKISYCYYNRNGE